MTASSSEKKKKQLKSNTKDNCAPTASCACDMNDHMKRGEGDNRLQGWSVDSSGLTCCRWCRRHCFPRHTAPVLGKHAGPVEQSGPGKINGNFKCFYSLYLNVMCAFRSKSQEVPAAGQAPAGWSR